jgi:hypothetical protein
MRRRRTEKQRAATLVNLAKAHEANALKAAGFPKGTDFTEALRFMQARLRDHLAAEGVDLDSSLLGGEDE